MAMLSTSRPGSGQGKNWALSEDFYERVKHELRERIVGELRFAELVLDIGCGSCELARFLAEKNRQHVIGVDISDGAFPNSSLRGQTVECRKNDARKLHFLEDAAVDAVVSVYALHEMSRSIEVLTEANRVLRAGGKMLIIDFPRGSLAQRLWNEDYYASTEVAEMLRQAGFADVESALIARGQLIWAEAHKAPAGKEMP